VAVAAQDTSQLFILSREIISIAFRLAYEVSRRMKLIEDTPESWGKTYTGLSREAIQDILDRFHESQVSSHLVDTTWTPSGWTFKLIAD
jgi:hypothetical protein